MQSLNRNPKRAIIVGAGPAGLTAAYELLTRTGILPLVIEKSDYLGGISRTVNYKGNRIDIGGHRFFSKSDRVMQWWLKILPIEATDSDRVQITYQQQHRFVPAVASGTAPLDPDKVMLVRKRKSRIYFMRQFFDYPITLSADTLLKLGVLKSLRIGLSYLRSLLLPIRNEVNLEQFLTNRFGRELYLTFFKSYTEKVWGIACHEISAEWGAQRIKGLSVSAAIAHVLKKLRPGGIKDSIAQKAVETSLIEQFLYPKFGPGQMWEEVADRIRRGGGEIRLNAAVEGLEHNNSGEIVSVTVRNTVNGALETISSDYVFSTMPVKELVACLSPPAPAAIRTISDGLIYRDFITVGVLCNNLQLIDPDGSLAKDNWIYIQEPDVFVGRIQIFNNWSSSLVATPGAIWIGLEYFCNQGDHLWQRTDAALIELAKEELAAMGMLARSDFLDATVIRMPKTYPAYFGTYGRFSEIVAWADQFSNLFLIGRNGMHKYNNQDHSMLTAMTAVDNILDNVRSRDNLWALNAEQEYHEERPSPPSKAPAASLSPKLVLQFSVVALLLGAFLCVPATRLSLWLDEILQLLLTRGGYTGWRSLLDVVAANAGGVPLGYITQAACIRLFGYSLLTARLPSILSAVVGCFGVGVLAVQAKVKRPWLALLLFCLLPLQLRYATEARPYEQALCLTIWASVLFLRLVAKPSLLVSLGYALLASLAIYTQPFAYFVVLAHLFWLVLLYAKQRTPPFTRTFFLSAFGVFLAGLSFVPWFLFARNHWHQAIASSISTRIDGKTLLVIAHELTGSGYIGAFLFAVLIALGLGASSHSRASRLFWAIATVAPVLLTLAADAKFGYFFAIRQIIFVLPPMVILIVFGFEALLVKSKAWAAILSVALLATMLFASLHWFSRPREDWQRASSTIRSQLSPARSCYLPVPQTANTLFEFFDENLSLHRCPDLRYSSLQEVDRVLVATGSYSDRNDSRASGELLAQKGFQPASVLLNLEPSVQLWERQGAHSVRALPQPNKK